MNKDNAKDYLPLVQALADGKVVEVRHGDVWRVLPNYDFTGEAKNYRIKPEPREIWVNEYPRKEPCIHPSEESAKEKLNPNFDGKTVRYREVLE